MDKKINPGEEKNNKVFTIPNLLSFFRLCLIPVIIWLYCIEDNYVWTGYLLILSGITDVADGFIARQFHMISDLGKILDPIADKLTQAAMMICLLIRFPLMICPFLLMLVKEMYMSVAGFLVIRKKGIVFGANWHGKAATFLLYMTMILHVFWQEIPEILSTALILTSTLLIGVSFILYGIRNTKALKETKM